MCISNSDIKKDSPEQAIECSKSAREKAVKIPLDNTTILDCLDIMKHEYEIERSKRQSFETRSGIIITILAALCIFIFDSVNISDIVELMIGPCTFITFMKIVSGLAIYVSFVLSLYFVIRTIQAKIYKNFNVLAVNEGFMGKPRIEGTLKLIFAYREIIIQHREANQTAAKALNKSIYSVAVAISAIIIYINL